MAHVKDWKWLLSIPAVVATVAGMAYAIDGRYVHHAELVQLAEDSEQARLETQLALYKLELAQLRAKQVQTADDLDREQYLLAAIAKIQERLAGIVGG